MTNIRIILLCIVIFLCRQKIEAQDTLKFTIEQAETQFLQKNLQVLAQRCNIGIAVEVK